MTQIADQIEVRTEIGDLIEQRHGELEADQTAAIVGCYLMRLTGPDEKDISGLGGIGLVVDSKDRRFQLFIGVGISDDLGIFVPMNGIVQRETLGANDIDSLADLEVFVVIVFLHFFTYLSCEKVICSILYLAYLLIFKKTMCFIVHLTKYEQNMSKI